MIYFVNQLLRVRRRWYIVVAITLVTVLGAFVAGIGDRTTYSAKAALSASSPTSENSPYALALAYIYLFNDPSFQGALARKANVPAGVTSVAEPATVGSIFYIDATASTPEAARSAASALASTFRTEINGALDDAKKQTIDSVEAPFEQRYAQRLEVPGDERAGLQDQINTINANTNGMINSVGLDSAVTATTPNRTTTLLTALAGGLVVGVLMALGVDIGSRRVRTGFDVTDKTAFTTALVVADPDDAGGSARASDLAHLANRVMSGSDTTPHVIAVVAAQSGAAAAARQLSETLASSLGTVDVPSLLVRTDARRSGGGPGRPGFVDALVDPDVHLTELVSAESGGVCTVDVGNRVLDPVGVVTRTSVARFLDAARKQAEVVLLEAPIVVESPEAQIICAQADIVITVVDPTTATVGDVSETYRLLAEVKARVGPAVVMSAPPVPAPPTPTSLTQGFVGSNADDGVSPEDDPADTVDENADIVGATEDENVAAGDAPTDEPAVDEFESDEIDAGAAVDEPAADVEPEAEVDAEDVDAQDVDMENVDTGVVDTDVVDTDVVDTDAETSDAPEASVQEAVSPPVEPVVRRPLRSVPTAPAAETRLSRAIRRAARWREEATARRTPPPPPRPRPAQPVTVPVAPVDEESQPEEFLPYRSLRSPVPDVPAELRAADIAPVAAEPVVELVVDEAAEAEAVREDDPAQVKAQPDAPVTDDDIEAQAEVAETDADDIEAQAEVDEEPDFDVESVEPEPEPELEPEPVEVGEPEVAEAEPGVAEAEVAESEDDEPAEVDVEPEVTEAEPEPEPEPVSPAAGVAPDAPLVPAAAGENAVPTDRFPALRSVVAQGDPFALERHAAAERAAHEEFLREQSVRQRWERELIARQQWVREQQAHERRARERRAQEEMERRKAIQERLARQQWAREQAAREDAERRERERVDRERVERLERERVARERAERLHLERIERARAAHLERERIARAEAARERLAREQREREERAAAEAAVAERVKAERLAAERLEEERRDMERRLEAERVARAQLERELAMQQQVARERLAQEQWAQYRLAQERWLEQQWSQYRAEQQRWMQQRAAGIDTPPPVPPAPNATPPQSISPGESAYAEQVADGRVVEGAVERRSDARG
ncbi:hypothetical protein ACXVUM_05335 [Williamsia sp. SKLECPSW1]